jgi:hypothetical protein
MTVTADYRVVGHPDREAAPLEHSRPRDAVKVMAFMAPWSGCAFTVTEVAIGTRIPPRRVAVVLRHLNESEWLRPGWDRRGEPTWMRP